MEREAKARAKRAPKTSTSSVGPEQRRTTPADEKYTNERVVEFVATIKGKVFQNEAGLEENVVDKLNNIAKKHSPFKDEVYEIRC